MNNISIDKKTRKFLKVLQRKPIEEQIAVSAIAKNVFNGCCWEFIRSSLDIKRNLDAFKNSSVCCLQKVIYDHKKNIYGYIIYMKRQYLYSLLDENNDGPLNEEDLRYSKKMYYDAKEGIIEIMARRYRGRIGIYHTKDSLGITVDGNYYPAFSVTLRDLCNICEEKKYGILIGDTVIGPEQILTKEDEIIENLTVAPGSDALFINIAPICKK